MLRRLGALLVCVALVTAGCIGSVSAGTADEHHGTADEQARQFAGPDAELVSVAGFESNESARGGVEGEGPYQAAILLTDEELGDGQAPAWVYSYRAANQTYRVAVDEEGTVIANETDDDEDEDQQPIEEWAITSEEAAETVADNEDNWATGGDGFGVYFLSNEEEETDDPTWKLGQITEQGLVVARVNANTGEFLGAQTRSIDGAQDFSIPPIYGPGDDEGPPEQPEQEGGPFSGTLTAAEATAQHSFEIEEDGHRQLGARLARASTTPGTTVNATIEGPNGTVGSLEVGGETVEVIRDWSHPGPGEYTFAVELTDGVTEDYEIDWCASGQPTGQDGIDDPCQRVAEGTQPQASLVPASAD